ncbi:MAG: hypothetical protein WCT31_04560 [Candidatus Micrarchaeia archaeon]|jgi:hypothetical protein
MVFGLFKQVQKNPEEEYAEKAREELAAKKAGPTEEKTENFQEFIKTPEAKKLIAEYTKNKKFTKRGVVKLLLILHPMMKSNKGVTSAAKDILSSLVGEDGLSRLLGVLKLVPEGIMK